MRARVRNKPDGSFALNLTAVALVIYRSDPADVATTRMRQELAAFRARIDHALACDGIVGRTRSLDEVLFDVCGIEALERQLAAGHITNDAAMDRILAVGKAAS